ncbi:hypothetical protein JAO76_14290 [Pontibacter sp. BT310]|uniref:Helix-hairpin-helix domain-containing protein n=1 Tax=Pontibacter populi TaxID=890055 RepID=A0ABS6XE65_9BACT|nr:MULTISPECIES: hypothetical protein [Pontibacter]MBJ6119375.1 hypothetical protein [Pontibacter sp. BT310]MBR0571803.1 hypothetical protein [Microvirga sp. STS03]MBW3366229.1 helix-hairpin-helix domain-containing protein [Pontibacter populi]
MVRTIVVLLLIFCSIPQAQAQNYPRQTIDFDLFVQELFSQQEDENISYEDLYETLFQYYQQPIDLNSTTPEELASLFILSRPQIASFFQHLQDNGKLLSIYELQAIPGFDLITIYQLLPFVKVDDAGLYADSRPLWQRMIGEDNNALIVRYERTLQQRRGYSSVDSSSRSQSRYLGSPDKLFMRYRNSVAQDYSLGITAEKDAGEAFTWDPDTRRYAFDFYTAHFQLYNKGRFKTIALGDYQLQIGQGLQLSSGYSVGKGSETITTISRANLGIRPYSSVLESAFFRGAAVTYRLSDDLNLTGFYSTKRTDANLQADTISDVSETFTGIQTSGFHRTETELANKGRVREQIFGSSLQYQKQAFTVGFTAVGTNYSSPIKKTDAPYQRFEFNGNSNYTAGTNYSFTWQNVYLFGETAMSKSGGVGGVNGLIANLSDKAEVAMLYRYYSRNFHSLYGGAFGEGSRNINERGFYTGIKLKPIARWEITAYYDRFTFPWLRYRVDAPSYGDEYLVRLYFKPNRQSALYAQFRTENKGLNAPNNTTTIDYVAQALRRNYLLYYEFTPTPALSLKSRVQFSSYEHEAPKQTGYLIAQDINYSFKNIRLSTRYALFDTDSYDTRQYVYERDVLYAFSIPALSGKGTRAYALLQFQLVRDLDVWVKYGITNYRNVDTIGSGLETIEGSTRSDMKAQVRYKF